MRLRSHLCRQGKLKRERPAAAAWRPHQLRLCAREKVLHFVELVGPLLGRVLRLLVTLRLVLEFLLHELLEIPYERVLLLLEQLCGPLLHVGDLLLDVPMCLSNPHHLLRRRPVA